VCTCRLCVCAVTLDDKGKHGALRVRYSIRWTAPERRRLLAYTSPPPLFATHIESAAIVSGVSYAIHGSDIGADEKFHLERFKSHAYEFKSFMKDGAYRCIDGVYGLIYYEQPALSVAPAIQPARPPEASPPFLAHHAHSPTICDRSSHASTGSSSARTRSSTPRAPASPRQPAAITSPRIASSDVASHLVSSHLVSQVLPPLLSRPAAQHVLQEPKRHAAWHGRDRRPRHTARPLCRAPTPGHEQPAHNGRPAYTRPHRIRAPPPRSLRSHERPRWAHG
jgi:hypothetical protein